MENILIDISSARIFLNVFGYILQDIDNVDLASRINIYDSESCRVGELYFEDNYVKINVGALTARYELPSVDSIRDGSEKLYLWDSEISFTFLDKSMTLQGTFFVIPSYDTKYGNSCRCGVYLEGKFSQNRSIILDMRRHCLFNLKIKDDGYDESIEYTYEIRHRVNGNYKYAVVSPNSYMGNLNIFLKQNGQVLFHRQDIPMEFEEGDPELWCKMANWMLEIDPQLFYKIQQLREILVINGVPLFDNFFNVCYDNIPDKTIESLFGIRRIPGRYQNGKTLKEAYFGDGITRRALN